MSLAKLTKKLGKYRPRHGKTDIEKVYKFGKELGTGSFAVVRLGTRKDNGQKVALKIIDKTLCVGKEAMIETEVAVMRKVSHPHIVKLIEEYDTEDKLYLVLEYVSGGELFDRIVEDGNFTEKDAARITRQMTEAVKHLHDLDIVHRDLKPENILFSDPSASADVKVADFGLSKLVNDDIVLQTACGTPNYVAPEILRQQGYSKPIDMWSIGVIAYIMLCGYPPFYDESDPVLFQKIMKGRFEFNQSYWRHISSQAKDLISRLLIVKPDQRLTADQVLQHPWIRGGAPAVNISESLSQNLEDYNAKRALRKNMKAVQEANQARNLNPARNDLQSVGDLRPI
eukprot:Clim_evm76s22 gene=Clim_evmTU76s22